MDIKLKEITEGRTKLFVPDLSVYKMPERAPIFYNPAMKTDRDISVLVLSEFFKKDATVADVLSGLGARAVRYANECGLKVTANDIQPSAIGLAKKNAKLNKIKLTTSVEEANLFLLSSKGGRFDCIDIDPFGSPAPFLNSAMKAISPVGGLLCITATDLGALSGNYPTACFRRYFIKAGRTSFEHELGIRNLIAIAFREGAKYNFTIEPVLAYSNIHYYRAFLKVTGGRKTVNRDLSKIGYVSYCRKCENRQTHPVLEKTPGRCGCGNELELFGPTWIAKLGDKDFLEKISIYNKILGLCYQEADIAEIYYDLHALAKTGKKKSVPSMDAVLEKLHNLGYKACRTNFSPHGIRTNAGHSVVRKLL